MRFLAPVIAMVVAIQAAPIAISAVEIKEYGVGRTQRGSLTRTKHRRARHAKSVSRSGSNKVRSYARATGSGIRNANYRPSGDYLGSMDQLRWSRSPVRVAVDRTGTPYRGIVAQAMSTWTSAAGGRLAWCWAPYHSADITITFSPRGSGHQAGLTTTESAYDESGAESLERAHVNIATRFEGRQLSNGEIRATVLHELGHALGLQGHSPNKGDIMYYSVTTSGGVLSSRDVSSIRRLYSQ